MTGITDSGSESFIKDLIIFFRCEIIGTDAEGAPVRGTAEMTLTLYTFTVPPTSVRLQIGEPGTVSQDNQAKVNKLKF